MKFLGIETSCDETAAGVVDERGRVWANVVASQAAVHARYGGVVPELASREHEVNLVPVVAAAVSEAGGWREIDAVAVTVGPGLQGSLLVGMTFAKFAAHIARKPLYGVNHLEGHLAALRLEGGCEPPFVALLATGGHTALYDVRKWGDYKTLGETMDDAAGEAFDKVAKLLGLPYPGGPPLEALAARGDGKAFLFPRPVLKQGYDFSFAGLKTAVALVVKGMTPGEVERRRADIAASFQEAALDVLVAKAVAACGALGRPLAVVGGVAANRRLREAFSGRGVSFAVPLASFCGDNGAMTAAAGFLAAARGETVLAAAEPVPGLPL